VVSPASTNIRINEYKTVMDTTEMKQTGILRTDVLPSLRYWLAVAHRRKAIFHTITKFRPTTENHADRNNHRGGEQKRGTHPKQSGSILLVVEGWMLADAAREVIMDLRTLSQGKVKEVGRCRWHEYFCTWGFYFLFNEGGSTCV
jgi:hypothetical protein